jgi:predicted transcriptional regulator
MNIQFVRLDKDVCATLNRLAEEQSRTVSELVNEMLCEYLSLAQSHAAEGNS